MSKNKASKKPTVADLQDRIAHLETLVHFLVDDVCTQGMVVAGLDTERKQRAKRK